MGLTYWLVSAIITSTFNTLKSANKIVLYEGTLQRAGGDGKPVWES